AVVKFAFGWEEGFRFPLKYQKKRKHGIITAELLKNLIKLGFVPTPLLFPNPFRFGLRDGPPRIAQAGPHATLPHLNKRVARWEYSRRPSQVEIDGKPLRRIEKLHILDYPRIGLAKRDELANSRPFGEVDLLAKTFKLPIAETSLSFINYTTHFYCASY